MSQSGNEKTAFVQKKKGYVNIRPNKDFRAHVRHFYKTNGNGIALTGTVAFVYDISNEVLYFGIGRVHEMDFGIATKKRGFGTAAKRAFKAHRNYLKGSRQYDDLYSFSVTLKELSQCEDFHIVNVFTNWMNRNPGDDTLGPRESNPNWMNSTNVLNLVIAGMTCFFIRDNQLKPDWIVYDEAYAYRTINEFHKSAIHWGVIDRFNPDTTAKKLKGKAESKR